MIALAELCSLPVAERLRLMEDLWNSIVEEQNSLPDSPAVVAEVRARKARFLSVPESGIPWEQAKNQIRSGGA